MTAIPPLGQLLRRAKLTPAELLLTLEARWPAQATEFFTAEGITAIALGERPCGLGMLRLWVAACRGTDADEVDVWVSQGWTRADAEVLVAGLPPRPTVTVVRAWDAAANTARWTLP